MAKIVHITTVHGPFDVRIFHKEARAVAAEGMEVVVIAPHGSSECVGYARIVGLPQVAGRFARMTILAWRAYRAARAEGAAIYHFHDPELLLLGLALKIRGHRVVYDVHEDVPRDIMVKDWLPWILRKPLAKAAATVEAIGAMLFDGIVTATPTIASRFPTDRTVVVRNFPSLQEFDSEGGVPYDDRPRHVLYLGAMHEKRGLYDMVDAMDAIDAAHDVRLRLAGALRPTDVDALAKCGGWKRVDALGWCERPRIVEELSHARVGLVVLHPIPTYVDSLPIKLFEYMAAGIPVVASDFPSWRTMIQRADCGILVDPQDSEKIADAVQWLLEHPVEARAMGARGRQAVREEFNWESESRKLVELYRHILV
jgi:glycosyltransferase involved in cell wall biosynthesis